MKWVFRRTAPPITRMLLVESGPRSDSERLIPLLREAICGDVPIDLFTCLPDRPDGLGPDTRAWRSYDASSHAERWRMLLGIRRERHTAAAILCSDSPLLGVWKIVLAALLPAKILLVDAVDGFFWLDRRHWRKTVQLWVSRSGIRNPEFVRKLAHAAFLPFGLCVLLGFAAKVHLRRLLRATSMAHRPEDRE